MTIETVTLYGDEDLAGLEGTGVDGDAAEGGEIEPFGAGGESAGDGGL
ncbi:MAG: hypothetical protein ACT4PL_00150 [Phycisphaerales bacterium]